MNETIIPLEQFLNTENFDNKESLYLYEKNGVQKILPQSNIDYLVKHNKPKPYESDDFFYFAIKKEGLSFFQKYGWLNSDYLLKMTNNKEDKNSFLVQDIQQSLIKTPSDLVIVERSSNDWGYIWHTNTGEYILEPLAIDWIGANLSNKNYHLDELVEKISQRNDCAFVSHLGRFDYNEPKLLRCPLNGSEDGIGAIIHDIEHHIEEGETYPTDETESAFIYYFPDHSDLKLITELVDLSLNKNKLPFSERIFNIKMYVLQKTLGAQQFLKNKPNENSIKRKFKQ